MDKTCSLKFIVTNVKMVWHLAGTVSFALIAIKDNMIQILDVKIVMMPYLVVATAILFRLVMRKKKKYCNAINAILGFIVIGLRMHLDKI